MRYTFLAYNRAHTHVHPLALAGLHAHSYMVHNAVFDGHYSPPCLSFHSRSARLTAAFNVRRKVPFQASGLRMGAAGGAQATAGDKGPQQCVFPWCFA